MALGASPPVENRVSCPRLLFSGSFQPMQGRPGSFPFVSLPGGLKAGLRLVEPVVWAVGVCCLWITGGQ